ncbi:MAG: CBS domain-containing protein [Vicinamibacterales bacterium]
MKVHDVMTEGVVSCSASANLAEVAQVMWEHDCGIVPIVNDRGEAVGVLTDRDVAIALGTRGKCAAEVRAGDVMSTPVVGCAPEDDIADVLATMQRHRIRRLPVLGIGGVLLGLASLNDIITHAPFPVTADPIVSTLRAIGAHEHAIPVAVSVS